MPLPSSGLCVASLFHLTDSLRQRRDSSAQVHARINTGIETALNRLTILFGTKGLFTDMLLLQTEATQRGEYKTTLNPLRVTPLSANQ